MSIKTYREAINEALLQEMKKDENVVVCLSGRGDKDMETVATEMDVRV